MNEVSPVGYHTYIATGRMLAKLSVESTLHEDRSIDLCYICHGAFGNSFFYSHLFYIGLHTSRLIRNKQYTT